MSEHPPIPRFDGTAAASRLPSEQRDELAVLALELVAVWLAIVDLRVVPRTPAFRAAEAAASRLTSGLIDRATDMLGLDAFEADDRPAIPSLIGPICIRCGCSEHDPCPEGCCWAGPDLCTACAPDQVRAEWEQPL